MGQQEKKRTKGRRAYLDDFEADKDGNYVYKGKVIVWPARQETRKPLLLRSWLLAAVIAAAVLVSGCVSGTGMETRAYVLLPYVVEVILMAYMCASLGRLTAAGAKLRAYVYDQTIGRLPYLTLFLAALAAACLVMQIVNMLSAGFSGSYAMGILLAVLQTAASLCSLLLRRILNQSLKETEQNK